MNIIEFKKVTKKFLNGKIIANDEISFNIKKGEIHAIAGENGAGKSTLLSMLFGLYKPDSGKILVRGKVIKYRSAAEAIKDGLGMVQQHFQLVEKFNVGQNILLGKEISKGPFLDHQEAFKKIDDLAQKYRFGIKANQKIKDLTVGQQQKTEILKLLYSDSEIFIFDEPTAMLIPEEIDHLLEVMEQLKKQGKTIILITHKLAEIKAVADRVSIIRHGKYVGELTKEKLDAKKLSQLMVGTNIKVAQKEKVNLGKTILEVAKVNFKKKGFHQLKNISFEVKQGEILAIAGVEGNGQSEMANVILGLNKINSGQISFYDLAKKDTKTNLTSLNINQRNQLLASIPEDRHKYGMVLDLKLYENMVLKNFWTKYSKYGFLKRPEMKKDAATIIKKYDVRGASQGMVKTRSLSGGNQQKAVVGRELSADHDLLIIFQATRGLDVGAIEYIHEQILKAAKNKKAILLISYDLNEIIKLADRVIVFNHGHITGEVTGKEINHQKLGILMSSKKEETNAKMI